jgi:hypothetical protein
MIPEIEPATAADAPAVIALWHACGLTRPWNDPASDFALALREAQSSVLVARGEGGIIGSAIAAGSIISRSPQKRAAPASVAR